MFKTIILYKDNKDKKGKIMENIKIEKVNSHWILGHFFLLGIPSGLRFYPINYKNIQQPTNLKIRGLR